MEIGIQRALFSNHNLEENIQIPAYSKYGAISESVIHSWDDKNENHYSSPSNFQSRKQYQGHALGALEANSPRGKFGVNFLCTVDKSNGEDNFNLRPI